MKIWLKVLLGVIGGFGGGFAAGFFAHKKINDIQFEEVTEEEFEKLMEGAGKDIPDASPEASRGTQTRSDANLTGDIPTDPDKLRNALQGKTSYIQLDNEKKQEYSKIFDTVKDYSDEENANELPIEDGMDPSFMSELDDEIRDMDERMEPDKRNEPYLITLGEFYEERREYDKITIDWYDEDNVVLDEREEVIPDPKTYVGATMQELFNKPTPDGDPDAVFVRNDKYGSDYEVIRHHASYRKAVLGEDDA